MTEVMATNSVSAVEDLDPCVVPRRVLILGDSWICGVSRERKTAFGKQLAQRFGASDIVDLSAISRTAPDVVRDFLAEIECFQPAVAIVNIGGADSLIFPRDIFQRMLDHYAPKEWHGLGAFAPAVMYSPVRRKLLWQKTRSFIGVILKQVLVNAFGGRRKVAVEEFERCAALILDTLTRCGAAILVVGFAQVDGSTSPKTNRSINKTNRVLKDLCAGRENALFVATDDYLRRWEDYLPDHVHLNREGHQRIADGIVRTLMDAGGGWPELIEV
jgi:lysophospholipase L1-like esterase